MSSNSNSTSSAFSKSTQDTGIWEPPADYDLLSEEWGHVPKHAGFQHIYRHDGNESNSEEDSGGNPKTFARVCSKFAERTSMQGIPYVHVSSSKHAKVLWVIIFLIGCACMTAHLYLLISDFYAYETQTQVDLGFSALQFPAITVCNVNRIRKSKVGLASAQLQELIESIQPSAIASAMEDYRNKPLPRNDNEGHGDSGVGAEPPPDIKQPDSQPGSSNDQQPPSSSDSQSDSSSARTQPPDTPNVNPQQPTPGTAPVTQSQTTKTSEPSSGTTAPVTATAVPDVTSQVVSSGSGLGSTMASRGPSGTDSAISTSSKTTTTPGAPSGVADSVTSAGSETAGTETGSKSTSQPESWASGSATTSKSESGFTGSGSGSSQGSESPNTGSETSSGAGSSDSEASTGSESPKTGSETSSGAGSSDSGSSTGSGSVSSGTGPPGSGSSGTESQGSSTGSSSGSNQPARTQNSGRRRKRAAASLIERMSETLERAAVRVKRYITGFEVQDTSGRFDPNKDAPDQDVYTGNTSVARLIEEEFKYKYSIEGRDTRINMGHRMKDMLVSCSFAGIECYARDFNILQTAEYGNCYTLENEKFLSIMGGPSDGLELILYLDQGEYLSGVTQSQASIQLLVHEPLSMPFPYRRGFAVPSGHENLIGLRQVNVFRATQPHGDCQDAGDPTLQAAGIKYSRLLCQMLCYQAAIGERCQCYDSSMEELNLRTRANNSDIRVCKQQSELDCLRVVEKEYYSGKLLCDCGNPCEETDYTKTHSFRAWPSDDYAKVLAQQLCTLNATNCDSFVNEDPASLRENFIKLNIYFEDLNYEDITEKASYEETQFISDVGGTIGLWIGLSIISFFEVFQFVYEALHFLFFIKPRQQAKAVRKSKLKQKFQEEAREIRKSERVKKASSAFSTGLQMGKMRPMSTLDSPTNFNSIY